MAIAGWFYLRVYWKMAIQLNYVHASTAVNMVHYMSLIRNVFRTPLSSSTYHTSFYMIYTSSVVLKNSVQIFPLGYDVQFLMILNMWQSR